MKGIFKDSKEWKIVVIGDWRNKNGKTVGYDEKLGEKLIYISGGIGMYYFHRGDFSYAVYHWRNDLRLIKKIETLEKLRFHKGWFYYQIGISYQNLGDVVNSRNYLRLAKQEDKITYGTKAKKFPASKIKEQ